MIGQHKYEAEESETPPDLGDQTHETDQTSDIDLKPDSWDCFDRSRTGANH